MRLIVTLVAAFVVQRGVSSASAQSAGDSASPAPAPAAVATPMPTPHRAGKNAVDDYDRAMALYKKLERSGFFSFNTDADKMDPKVAAALSAKIQPIVQLTRDAETADYAEWDDDPSNPKNQQHTPMVFAMADLTSLLLWDAGYCLKSNPKESIQDLAAEETLARCGGTDSVQGFTMSLGACQLVVPFISRNANALADTMGNDLKDFTNVQGVADEYRAAFNADAGWVEKLIVRDSDPAKLSLDVKQMGMASGPALVTDLKWIAQVDKEAANELQVSDPEYKHWLAIKQGEAASIHDETSALPLVGSVRPAAQALELVDSARPAAQAEEEKIAMLAAGLALQRGDQALFQAARDPIAGQPFTVSKIAGGFKLISTFIWRDGTPITLTFDVAPAK